MPLAAGAIDFGHASDGIGVFQQASGKGLVYLAAESPYPGGVGFLVPRDSPIRSVRDLKGRKVVTGRGYNTQYVLIRALEAAGLRYEDIEPVYIVTASDTVAAYQSGSVAAIGLWDPFLAGAQQATESRLLFDGTGLSGNRTYHFAQPEFARANAHAGHRPRTAGPGRRVRAAQAHSQTDRGEGRLPGPEPRLTPLPS